MADITFKHVKKVYDKGNVVVPDLNLEIKDKEFIVLVGPSGCGKSTTLRMIAGLEEVSDGELYIGDRLVNNVAPKDRDIAMVFQSYALYPHMTVYKNMAFALELRKTPKDEIDKKVHEAAKILGLEEYLDRKPKALSGGQRQRVALGRALVRDPQVFLLDEPLGNLDAKLRDQVRYELKKIQTQLGVTTIYVTHDQTEAMTMADHIVLMKDGHIMQQGTPNDLYAHPNSLFVASFVGTPQINKLTCKVVEKGGSLAFQCGELLLSVPDDLTALMQQYRGKEVIVGLRPSELTLAPEGQGEIEGTVDSVEPLGDGFIVYLKAAGQMLVAKIAGGSTVIGKTISLNIEKGKFHIFDSQTEERLNP